MADPIIPAGDITVEGSNIGAAFVAIPSLQIPDTAQVSPLAKSPLPRISPSPLPSLKTNQSADVSRATPEFNAAIPAINIALPKNALPLVPWAPTDATERKYHRDVFYSPDATQSDFSTIKCMHSRFNRQRAPDGWTAYTSLGGKPMFHHQEKGLMTFTNLYDQESREDIETAAEEVLVQLAAYRASNTGAPDDIEICLCKTWSPALEPVVGYYLASMAEESIFWLEDVATFMVTNWDRVIVSEAHLGLAVKAQFWYGSLRNHSETVHRTHVEMFPCHRGLAKATIDELQDGFNASLCDHLTSSTSMFSWNTEDTILLKKCIAKVQPGVVNAYHTFVVARLLSTLYRDRFLSFYGEPGARLDRNDTAFGGSIRRPRSWIFTLLSPFLFFMPLVYMNDFDKLYVDNSVHYHFWQQFIVELKRDWEGSITPATVLLSANVGFLAIQSIDSDTPNRNAAQIISYISAILSLFIYIVSQILMRHHRHHPYGHADTALSYIIKREKRLIGLQAVAIAFSLPTALFLWSMLTFLAALMVVFFDGTSSITRIAISAVLLILFAMVGLLLYLERDNTVSEDWQSPYMRLYHLLDGNVRSWMDNSSICQRILRYATRRRGSTDNMSMQTRSSIQEQFS